MKLHTLDVGEPLKLEKKSLFGKHSSILFAGMPSDSCYSIVAAWSHGYNSAAYNLFFPLDQSHIEVLGNEFELKKVSPNQIELAQH